MQKETAKQIYKRAYALERIATRELNPNDPDFLNISDKRASAIYDLAAKSLHDSFVEDALLESDLAIVLFLEKSLQERLMKERLGLIPGNEVTRRKSSAAFYRLMQKLLLKKGRKQLSDQHATYFVYRSLYVQMRTDTLRRNVGGYQSLISFANNFMRTEYNYKGFAPGQVVFWDIPRLAVLACVYEDLDMPGTFLNGLIATSRRLYTQMEKWESDKVGTNANGLVPNGGKNG